jgi:hypothetical protein
MMRICLLLKRPDGSPLFDSDATSQQYIALSSHENRTGLLDIISTWAEGYHEIVGTNSNITTAQSREHWDDMIECLMGDGFGQWLIPIVSAVISP